MSKAPRKEPYIYKLYIGSPEDSQQALVQHAKSFSPTKLSRLFGEALTKAGKAYRKKEIARLRECLGLALAEGNQILVRMWRRHLRQPDVQAADVFDEAVDLLCATHGFARVPFEFVVSDVGAWDTVYPSHKQFGK